MPYHKGTDIDASIDGKKQTSSDAFSSSERTSFESMSEINRCVSSRDSAAVFGEEAAPSVANVPLEWFVGVMVYVEKLNGVCDGCKVLSCVVLDCNRLVPAKRQKSGIIVSCGVLWMVSRR